MKEKINILILIFLILGVLIGGFLIWQSYQKTERQYKTCLEICEASSPSGLSKYNSIFDPPSEYSLCIITCKEKYGK